MVVDSSRIELLQVLDLAHQVAQLGAADIQVLLDVVAALVQINLGLLGFVIALQDILHADDTDLEGLGLAESAKGDRGDKDFNDGFHMELGT